MSIDVVGVIGAGVMGTDIAMEMACNGKKVILKDLNAKVLESSKEKISNDYKMLRMIRKDIKLLTIDNILSNINFTIDYDAFEQADIIIENVTEDWEVKKRVYIELRNECKVSSIYAVNTSCISITKIGALLLNPAKVIGMHFMNPVPLKEMVEVIRGYHTSDETVNESIMFLKSLKKTPVVVNDMPGFVTNRVLMLTINECIWAVHDNVATPKDVDKIFRLGFGHKMGPLATADLIGLDTILNALIVLYDSFKDSKYRPCPLLEKMVNAGVLGKKTSRGFFNYSV